MRPICLLSSLVLILLGCQTLAPEVADDEVLAAQKSLVVNFLDAGEVGKALKKLRQLHRKHDADPELENLSGLAQLAAGNYARAANHFRRSYRMQPTTHAGLNLSSVHLQAGRPGRAVAVIKRLLSRPATAQYAYRERLYHNLAISQAKLGRPRLAELAFRQALQENPVFYISQIELAKLYLRRQQPRLAESWLTKSMNTCSGCFEPVKLAAELRARAGRTAEAMALVHRFRTRDGLSEGDRQQAQALLTRLMPRSRRAGGSVARRRRSVRPANPWRDRARPPRQGRVRGSTGQRAPNSQSR